MAVAVIGDSLIAVNMWLRVTTGKPLRAQLVGSGAECVWWGFGEELSSSEFVPLCPLLELMRFLLFFQLR